MNHEETEESMHHNDELTRKQLLVRGGGLALSMSALPALLSACGGSGGSGGNSADVGSPRALAKAPTQPFDPNVKPGAKSDLPRRIAWSLPTGGELFTTFENSVRQAVEDSDIEFLSAQANGDSAKQVQQSQAFLTRGIGALIAIDVAPPALAATQLQAIKRDIAVFCADFAPSTVQLTWDQYEQGHAQGMAAVKWIKEQLGGKANVANLIIDTNPHLRPRYEGVRDALKEGGPGIKLVVEQGGEIAAESGFKLTNTILQKYPDIDVWIGTDTVLGGTLSALKAAGKAGDNVGIFGVDGDAQALSEIVRGGPYKATQTSVFPVIAYAWGKYAADWFDGKSIPMVLSVRTITLDSQATVDAFKQIAESPASAFKDNETSFEYFKPLGNTSYEQHRYLTQVV